MEEKKEIVMVETQLLMIAASYAAYCCTCCTILLWFLPTPEKAKEVFLIQHVNIWYLRFYNILRWMSGNRAWKEARNGNGKPPEPTNPIIC